MGSYEPVENSEQTSDRPPFTVDLLADEIRKYRRLPQECPRDPLQAAKWWIGMQKPANEQYESPARSAVAGQKDVQRWLTPYADRLIASFRRFRKLNRRDQEFVIAAAEDGCWYNGDEPKTFYKIYEETQRMRSIGREKYRAEAMGRMKQLARRMT